MDPIYQHLTKRQSEMLRMLRKFVEAESPSTVKIAVDRFAEMIGGIAAGHGARIRVFPSRQTGNHLRAEFAFGNRSSTRHILLLGHLDTVWELRTLARMPFRVRGGRAYGPGTFDMKGGIVIALFAIEALRQTGISLRHRVVLLLNGDEEIGSPSSRTITEREARRSDSVLVIEPAQGPRGALKTARKGVGEFQIRVLGRPAHAGLEPEKGASATVELARQILRLEKLANPRRGLTLNPGIIRGGTRTNVIAAEAVAQVDVRIARAADARKIERQFRALRPFDRRTRLEITGGLNRPPMERTPQTAALFERARRLAKSLGISIEEASAGGGSDGNFTAALGVATLDGLGAVGNGAHAAHEHIIIRELPLRAALLAHLIASLAREPLR